MEAACNVLLVDDESSVVELLEENLKAKFPDCRFYKAADGLEAIRILSQVKVSAMVLDMNLPKRSGKQVLEQISYFQIHQRPKLIFLISGDDYSKFEVKTEKKHILFSPKPIDFDLMFGAFEDFLYPGKRQERESKKSKEKMDVRFMNPFIDSTIKVLEIMAHTTVEKDGLSLEKTHVTKGDVSAYYPIESSLFHGFFLLSFPKKTFLQVASKMLMENFTEINYENRDAIAELCNQIFGNAKAFFNDKFDAQISMATPTIISGKDHSLDTKIKSPVIVVNFKTEHGNFFIETAVKAKK